MPPSPRAASDTSVPAAFSGSMRPDGWNCTSSGSRMPAAGLHGEAERVAGVLVAARRGAPPDAGVAAGGEDDGVGVDDVARAVVEVEAVRAEDDVVVDQEPGDVDRVEDRDLELRGAVDERALDLQAGVVAGERGAAEGVRAEEPLRDPPVVLAGERHAVAFEVLDAARGALGHDLHRARVGEQIALLERVGGVLLPGVLGIHGRQRRVDAAGGERGVGVSLRPLADREHVDPLLGEFDRGAQPGASRPDHQHGRRDPLFISGQCGHGCSGLGAESGSIPRTDRAAADPIVSEARDVEKLAESCSRFELVRAVGGTRAAAAPCAARGSNRRKALAGRRFMGSACASVGFPSEAAKRHDLRLGTASTQPRRRGCRHSGLGRHDIARSTDAGPGELITRTSVRPIDRIGRGVRGQMLIVR